MIVFFHFIESKRTPTTETANKQKNEKTFMTKQFVTHTFVQTQCYFISAICNFALTHYTMLLFYLFNTSFMIRKEQKLHLLL